MKQQINLYVGALRPQKESLSLTMVLISWGAAILLVAVASIWLSSRLADAEYQLTMTQMTNKQLSQQIADLTLQLQQRQPSGLLTQRKEQAAAELKIKNLLLAELSHRAPMKNKGFSELMLELASYHDVDIWLNGIQASENQLALTGFSRSAEAVPRWVQGFQAGMRLRQAGFASLNMSRDEQQRLSFTLSSLPGGGDE